MNKFGIRVYGDSLFIIDDIHYKVNSIKHEIYSYNYKCRYRMIHNKCFGINFEIIIKRR